MGSSNGIAFSSCINAVFLTKKGHIKYNLLNVNMCDHENKKSESYNTCTVSITDTIASVKSLG